MWCGQEILCQAQQSMEMQFRDMAAGSSLETNGLILTQTSEKTEAKSKTIAQQWLVFDFGVP